MNIQFGLILYIHCDIGKTVPTNRAQRDLRDRISQQWTPNLRWPWGQECTPVTPLAGQCVILWCWPEGETVQHISSALEGYMVYSWSQTVRILIECWYIITPPTMGYYLGTIDTCTVDLVRTIVSESRRETFIAWEWPKSFPHDTGQLANCPVSRHVWPGIMLTMLRVYFKYFDSDECVQDCWWDVSQRAFWRELLMCWVVACVCAQYIVDLLSSAPE